MVIADRNNESSSSFGSSNSNRRTRTLNSNITSTSSSNIGSCSSDIDDSDSEQSVRVGAEFQAEIPETCLPKPASSELPDKAVLIWTPDNGIDQDHLNDYAKLAEEKYNYSEEQALGILFWHDFDLQCALADLPNYAPYPDEWTMEDRALFEQAFQFHNKNFHKINQLLPDKKLSSIVKYYYTEKKVKSRNSYVDKQVRKTNSQAKDDMDMGNDGNDYENEVENNSTSLIDKEDGYLDKRQCALCMNQTCKQYFNTKFGILCKSCYNKRKSSLDGQSSMEEMDKMSGDSGSLLSDDVTLRQIAKERLTNSTSKVLQGYDNEINDLKDRIRKLKQENAAKHSSVSAELPDLSLLNLNEKRIISRWTNEEMFLMTQAIRDYGKDFKIIAEIMGTKTELQIKNYFLQNQDKMKNLLEELKEEENDDPDDDDEEKGRLYIVDDFQQESPQSQVSKSNKLSK